MTQLSAHFTRRHLEFSQTAERKGIVNVIPNDMLPYWTEALIKLIEPIYEAFPRFVISSAYRCPKLNRAIGGSRNSQHTGTWRNVYCCAFDLDAGECNTELVKYIDAMARSGQITFDQLIFEGGTTDVCAWVHVSTVWGWLPRGHVLRKLFGQPYELIGRYQHDR